MSDEDFPDMQRRNKAKVKKKENKHYPYKHCRHCGKIIANEQNKQN